MMDLSSLLALFGRNEHGQQQAPGWNPAGASPVFGMQPTAQRPWFSGSSAQMTPPMRQPMMPQGAGQPQLENPPLPPYNPGGQPPLGGPLPPLAGGDAPGGPNPIPPGMAHRPAGMALPPGIAKQQPGYVDMILGGRGVGLGGGVAGMGQPPQQMTAPQPTGAPLRMKVSNPRPDTTAGFGGINRKVY